MSIKITYFVHGTTTDNENNISSGWEDAELSKLGVQQMIGLKEKIANKKFDIVFCSDLRRAVKSAYLTFGDEQKIIIDSRLRECNYGDFNAKESAMVEPMQEKMIFEKFPNGESYEDVKIRVADFLNYLKTNFDNQSVAIVAHKAPQLALEVILNSKSWEQAFAEDWRKTKSWQPGWDYFVK